MYQALAKHYDYIYFIMIAILLIINIAFILNIAYYLIEGYLE